MQSCRVVVVDDSVFIRKFITNILESDKDIKVVATAVNGIDAIHKVKEFRPDVVTLDIEMPQMDGLTALRTIMQDHPCPVVMVSSHTKLGAEATIQALELGAVDFVAKPSGDIYLDMDLIRDELILKVKVAAQAYYRIVKPPMDLPYFDTGILWDDKPQVLKKIVAIGCSTGGPRALHTLISGLPGNIPAALVIVQHMPPKFTKSLAERLNTISQLQVLEANDGDELLAGQALLAPGDKHMKINNIGGRFFVKLTDEPPVGGLRPSIDKMMVSLAECKFPLIGVILTGMGQDGVQGLKKIKEVNGYTIAEDESTCIVYGMPRAAAENKCVDKIVPLPLVAKTILENL